MCDRLAALDGLVPPAVVACRSTPSSPNAYRAVVQLQQLEKTSSVPDLQQKRHHHGDGPAADQQAAPASACPDSKSDGCLTDTGRAPVTSLSGTFLTPPCKSDVRAGARFLGAPLAIPFKVAPTDWSPATIAECSTPTHGYYRRSFPQTVGRWHSDRSGLVSSGRAPPSGCSPSSARRLSGRFPVYFLTEVCDRLQNTFHKSPDLRTIAGTPTF
ncbi:hypothetical protein QTP88_021809 [Uroleucon formosanum]